MSRARMNQLKRKQRIQLIRRRAAFVFSTCILICFLAMIGFSATTNATDPAHAAGTKCYSSILIENGDSLWSIANDNMDSHYDSVQDYIDEIVAINHLGSETKLTSGAYLIIPYYTVR